MNEEQWERVQELFNQALELDPVERPGFLEQACGEDAELLEEVQVLIAHDEAAHARGFLNERTGGAASDDEQASNLIGTTIGTYELLEELGRGGWGVVYKAWQTSLERLVAVKVILNDEFASETDRHRFANEARVLARLAHPHIVQVFDFGEHLGKPYFLDGASCRGESLPRNLPRLRLPLREAVALIETLSPGRLTRCIVSELSIGT